MKVFEVGGCVRDELMGVKPVDRDWVVINSSPAEMEQSGFKPIGKDFPVFLHQETKEEYALARTERKSGKGYKDFTFYFDSSVTLEEDLKRRDLTINAMSKDSDGNITDPFGGKEDIQKKIFRHTSNAFAEDPLRALRLARFKTYAHLKDFEVAEETSALLREIAISDELSSLSADRVWMETFKALSSPYTENFFESLVEHGLLNPWFTDLEKISIDGITPEHKWIEMQRVNHFNLCSDLPIPKSFQKGIELFKLILSLINCSETQEKIVLIESINFPRNHEEIKGLFELKILQPYRKDLDKISNAIMSINFSQLAEFDGNAVSEKKQFLYHEALKSIL